MRYGINNFVNLIFHCAVVTIVFMKLVVFFSIKTPQCMSVCLLCRSGVRWWAEGSGAEVVALEVTNSHSVGNHRPLLGRMKVNFGRF